MRLPTNFLAGAPPLSVAAEPPPPPFDCDGLSSPMYSRLETIRISWKRH